MLYSSKLENNSQCTRPSFVHAMVVASQCPTVVKIMLIRFDNAAETIVQLYDCSIATTMEPRDGVKYNDGVPRAQCACNREGYFLFAAGLLFFGSWFYAYCFSASLLFCLSAVCFPSFCFSCFSAFHASPLLCFPCFFFSASLLSLLLCFSAFVLLCLSTSTILPFSFLQSCVLLLYFLLHRFSASCLYYLFVFSFLLLYSLLFVS